MKEFLRNKNACFWIPLKYRLQHVGFAFPPLCLRGTKYFHIGQGSSIMKGARIECYKEYAGKRYNPSFNVGENTLIGYNFTALVTDDLSIGNNCLIASNVFISTENHGVKINGTPYINQILTSKKVVIGNNCWIGEKAVILPGAVLGDNVIVGGGQL